MLDVGAGTGRVTLDLARHGHAVDGARRRSRAARGAVGPGGGRGPADVRTVCADARDFVIDGEPFALIIVPMQTIQLLDGARGRVAFLRTAREHLRPGGLVALAIADAMEGDRRRAPLPAEADRCELDGVTSTPARRSTSRDDGHAVVIERVREIRRRRRRATADRQHACGSTISTRRGSKLEGEAVGLSPEPALDRRRTTDEYVGSTVVMLRA